MSIGNSLYQKSVLPNGIRVVTERIPHVRSVAIGVWLTVGSRNESLETNGISHYIEHMFFKGTEERKAHEIAESLESVGGHLNAFTGKELTCYYAHVLDEHLPIAMDVISDILLNSVFDENEMEKEKQVIIEEINTLEDTPEELIHDIFNHRLYPDHPLGFSVIGSRQNVLSFKRQDLLRHIDKNYTADRVVIAAAGNVDHATLVRETEHRFVAMGKSHNSPYTAPPPAVAGRYETDSEGIQAHICLGTHAYPYPNRKKFPLLILNTLLGAGMSSRLFQNIRERYGLAYSVYSFIDMLSDTGVFGVYTGTDKSNVDASIDLIGKELERFRQEPVSEAEMSRTKSQLKGNLMLGLESTSSRMSRLAKMEIYLNRYYNLDDTLKDIEQVTFDEVLEVARELFQPERICTTILKPTSDSRSQNGGFYDSWHTQRNQAQ